MICGFDWEYDINLNQNLYKSLEYSEILKNIINILKIKQPLLLIIQINEF